MSEPDWLLRHRARRLAEQATEERERLVIKALTEGLSDEEKRRLLGLVTSEDDHYAAIAKGPTWP